MDGTIPDDTAPETISILWLPTPRTSSSVYSDELSDQSAGRESVLRNLLGGRPCSSVYSDNFPLEELVQRVDATMQSTHLAAIERLERERQEMLETLKRCRRARQSIGGLFDRTLDVALLIRNAIVDFDSEITAVERAWIACWGIEQI